MNQIKSSQAFRSAGPVDAQLSSLDFQKLAAVVLEFTGITLPDTKKMLLQARLTKRLRALNFSDFGSYCDFIRGNSEAAQAEKQQLISAITTNVTRFFREAHHFDDLRKRALPPLIERAKRGGRVRLWSAGCSSGQEPYSLAFTILDMLPDAERYDIRVLATDLDTDILKAAVSGDYPVSAAKDVKPYLSIDPFEPHSTEPDKYVTVRNNARSLVSFKQLNLVEKWPLKGNFDIIFCRNVVIYFDQSTEFGVFKQFSEHMAQGALLYLGHSERINTSKLQTFTSDGITTYRRL